MRNTTSAGSKEGLCRRDSTAAWSATHWARRLSWQEVADVFWVSWDRVYRAVQAVVAYGLAHRDLSGIEAIGVDEVAYAKGHRYATVVYQLNGESRRLLHVSEGRKTQLVPDPIADGIAIALVPEPATLGLMTLGGLMLLRRRRG